MHNFDNATASGFGGYWLLGGMLNAACGRYNGDVEVTEMGVEMAMRRKGWRKQCFLESPCSVTLQWQRRMDQRIVRNGQTLRMIPRTKKTVTGAPC